MLLRFNFFEEGGEQNRTALQTTGSNSRTKGLQLDNFLNNWKNASNENTEETKN